jgi:cytochrome c peroxidase
LEESWTLKTTHNGAKWTGPQQFESKDKTLMMLPNDYALIQDGEFRKIVELYAKDEAAIFKDFAGAFSKLLELGVPFPQQKKGWW